MEYGAYGEVRALSPSDGGLKSLMGTLGQHPRDTGIGEKTALKLFKYAHEDPSPTRTTRRGRSEKSSFRAGTAEDELELGA